MALPLQVVHTFGPGVYKINITYIEVLGASGLKIANPGCLFLCFVLQLPRADP